MTGGNRESVSLGSGDGYVTTRLTVIKVPPTPRTQGYPSQVAKNRLCFEAYLLVLLKKTLLTSASAVGSSIGLSAT